MGKDDNTYLNLFYVFCGLVVAYIGWEAINFVGVQMNWLEKHDSWYPLFNTFSAIVIGVAFVFYLKSDKERHQHFLDSVAELRKVTWPSADDTRKMTTVVVIVVGIFAALLALFDLGWAWVIKQLIA